MQKSVNKETSSIQAELPSKLANRIIQAGKSIPAEHLAGDGIDIDVPHVTVRYGVDSDDAEPLSKIVHKYLPFFAKLGSTKTFDPGEDGSVPLYVEVLSPNMFGEVRKAIEQLYQCQANEFPTYVPHVTVAFVKPEFANLYTGITDLKGEWIVSNLTLSDRNGCKTSVGK